MMLIGSVAQLVRLRCRLWPMTRTKLSQLAFMVVEHGFDISHEVLAAVVLSIRGWSLNEAANVCYLRICRRKGRDS